MPVQSYKTLVRDRYPRAFTTKPGHEYIVWNHGDLNKEGYRELGRATSAQAAWRLAFGFIAVKGSEPLPTTGE